MDFEIGSIANLISGNKSPSGLKKKEKSKTSQKVVVNFKSVQKDSKRKRELAEDESGVTDNATSPKHKKAEHKGRQEKSNAEKRIERKNKKLLRQNSRDNHSEREIFIGNVPIDISKKKLKSLFSQYGQVENVRLRGAPVSDPRIPKKVAIIKKKFHPDRSSLIAYLRFVDAESAKKAIAANGMLLEDHHLRVTAAVPPRHDNKKTIFVGNVPFDAEEDDLWKMFAECGTIASVRIMRDTRTGISRGVAYINFESADAVELALKLDGEQLKKRNIRVNRFRGKKPKGDKSQKRKSEGGNDYNEPKQKRKKKNKKKKQQDENVDDSNEPKMKKNKLQSGTISEEITGSAKKVNNSFEASDHTNQNGQSKKSFKLKKSFQGQKVAEQKGKLKKKKNKENLKKKILISKIGKNVIAKKKKKQPTFPVKKLKFKPFVKKMKSKAPKTHNKSGGMD